MNHTTERIVTAGTLIIFALSIIYLYGAQKLNFYVYPTHAFYITLSAVLLILTGLYLLLFKKHIHLHLSTPSLLIALFIPVLLIISLPARPLYSDAALARGVIEDLPVFYNDTSFSFSVEPKNRQLLDWIKAFNADPEPNTYASQEVKIKGFIVPTEVPHIFFLTQFYIACCAADARPIAIPVEYPESFTPKKDDWVEVEGVMKSGEMKGERKVIIDMKKATPIPTPSNPYAF